MTQATAGVLAVDLGGTRMRAAVFDAAGTMRVHLAEPTPHDDPRALFRLMRRAIAGSPVTASRAVIGVPGLVDYQRAAPLVLPNLPAWTSAMAASAITEAIGLPAHLANDADLAALGEQRFGAGEGIPNMVYVTCSTGVGAGVILDGRLLHSRYSLAEVGQTLLDWRTGEKVEARGSGTALLRLTGETAQVIERRARDGDAEAARQFRAMADAFAVGVLTMIRCFSPDRVVIGGGVANAGDLLLEPIRELVRATPQLPTRDEEIVRGTLGDDAGLRGAFALACDLADGANG
jgi:glucokinase